MSTLSPTKFQRALRLFTGCEQPYRHPYFTNLVYTDGVQFLAQEGDADWLLAIVGSILPDIQKVEFTVVKLAVRSDLSAVFTCDDGNDNVYYTQEIPFTDFMLPEITLYYANNILYLPSEH